VISKLLQANRKALAKIRMFVDRPRQIHLIPYPEKVLERDDQEPRRRSRQKICDRRKVGPVNAALPQRLIQGRAAQIYNPVWLFVSIYQRIFLRVTLGASRLQEVLADRYAAIAYGSQNFIEGLQSVIRQTIAFPLQANHEVRRSFELKQPVNNLYSLPVEESLQGELDKQLEETMKRATSQYDSHPAPHERIAWIERLRIPYSAMHDNPQPALRLFPNPEELQREMTAQIMKNVRA